MITAIVWGLGAIVVLSVLFLAVIGYVALTYKGPNL